VNKQYFVAIGLALLAFSAPAHAQYGYGSFTYPSQTFVGTNIMARTSEAESEADRGSAKRGSKPSVSTSAVTTYSPSAARTRANLAAFASKTRKVDPEGAAKMDQLFASTDIIGQIGQGIAPYGLKTNNVADAYAVYWINAWEASRGIAGASETRQRAQAVRTQASNAMAAVPALATATDAQKQEFAEAMLVQAALISAYMDDAAGNPAQLRAIGAAVAKGAKAMGLDLDTMDLTPNGFVPAKGRKRSDAGDALDGDAANGAANSDTTLASNDAPNRDNAPSDPLSGPLATYALIAAAGGAGLGGVFLIGKAMGKKGQG
jgi:hypothetical protein